MSDEIKALEEAELAALRQLEELREKKRKAIDEQNRKLAEARLTKPIEIEVFGFDGAMVKTRIPYREDIIAILRNTPGRAYRSDKENAIPASEWTGFLLKTSQLRNITITYVDGIKEKIDRHLNAPVWEITAEHRWLRATPGPAANRWILGNIPGSDWNTQGEFYRIPLSEGYRLPEVLKDVEGVVWEEDAQKLVFEQLERRVRLDQLATLKISPRFAERDFNGYKLMPFQTVGVDFLDAANGNVMLCDEMGLGKTLQALAYALVNNYRTVVVCPASLKPNWLREIKKFGGSNIFVCHGSQPGNYDMKKLLIDKPTFTIINYEILRRKMEVRDEDTGAVKQRFLWAELLTLSKPDLLIVDEGHYIKDVEALQSRAVRSIKAPRTVFLTGTPVINRPGELWPMLNMIAPESFPAFETFLRQYTYDGKAPRNAHELRASLRHLMLRRLKKDVLDDLPRLRRVQEFFELSDKAQKLYQKVLQGIFEELSEWNASGQPSIKQVNNILVQIGRLKQIVAIDAVDHTADLATRLYDQTDESVPRKVLIFSSYKATAYAIYQRLADQGALCFVSRSPSEFVTAGADERDRLVQQFQTDPSVKYLVVTEKTTKEGHNITAAGHVIFNDLFWTPAAHDQALSRAYARLSDMHGVDAYFIVAQFPEVAGVQEDSIADWNWGLLKFKEGVIETTVEGLHEERDASGAQMAIIEKLKELMWTRKKK